jgi:hypothetical protein
LFWPLEAPSALAGAKPQRAQQVAEPETKRIRELAAYWESKRAGRFAPRRADIDPADIRAHMPTLMMVDVLPDGDYRYRLMGTSLTEGRGRTATGQRVTELMADRPDAMRQLKQRFDSVVAARAPVYSRGEVYWETDADDMRMFECGYFPLSDDGETVSIILAELIIFWPGDGQAA